MPENKSNEYIRLIQKNLLELKLKKKKKAYPFLFKAKIKKQLITFYEKIFFYFNVKVPTSYYTHKAFILLEMQVNTILQRTKLVPYYFIAIDLCFYRIVKVNTLCVKSPYFIISLYDVLSLPLSIYVKFYLRQSKLQIYPSKLTSFLQNYWLLLRHYRESKVWLFSSFITSFRTAEVVVFDYPNLMLYSEPFVRYTQLYMRSQPITPVFSQWQNLLNSQAILKIRLFDYAAFYKSKD